MSKDQEKELLDSYAETYRRSSRQDDIMRELVVRTIEPFLPADGVGLELGCSDGYMTELLSARLKELEVIEGSEKFIEEARLRKLSNVRFCHELFDDYQSDRSFDVVLASYMMTHVAETAAVYRMIRSALKPNGYLFVVVPNVRALSRQLALHMGFIQDLKALSENDRNHGHQRAYDRISLDREIESNGFSIVSRGGVMLKQLADFQMDALYDMNVLDETHVNGLFKLGQEYPDLCSAIYSICQLDGGYSNSSFGK